MRILSMLMHVCLSSVSSWHMGIVMTHAYRHDTWVWSCHMRIVMTHHIHPSFKCIGIHTYGDIHMLIHLHRQHMILEAPSWYAGVSVQRIYRIDISGYSTDMSDGHLIEREWLIEHHVCMCARSTRVRCTHVCIYHKPGVSCVHLSHTCRCIMCASTTNPKPGVSCQSIILHSHSYGWLEWAGTDLFGCWT